MLITDIAQFRSHVQVAHDFTLPRIGQWLDQAAREYLLPTTGPALLHQLQQHATTAASGSGSAETTTMDRLLVAAQKVEAIMAFYLAVPTLQLQMHQAGLFAVSNEQYKSAYQWQVGDYRESWLLAGYSAVEALYQLLEELRPAAWVGTPAQAAYQGSLLRNAAEFQAVYSIGYSRITYVDLRPGLQRAQQLVLAPRLGEAFYQSLLHHLAGEGSDSASADTSTWNDQAVERLRPALAQLAIAHATEVRWRTVNGSLLSTRYDANSAANQSRGTVGGTNSGLDEATQVRDHAQRMGMQLLASAQQWLDAHADHFPLYRNGPGYRPQGQDQRPASERIHNRGGMLMM